MAVQNQPAQGNGWVSGPILMAPPHPHYIHIRPQAHIIWTPTPVSPSSHVQPKRWRAPASRSFHYFSKLPPELRIKVWVYAAPGKRIVELRSWGDRTRNDYTPIRFSAAPHRPPSILHVNQESRQEALRLYQVVKIGVSAAVLHPSRTYVPWKFHPANRNAVPNFTAVTYPLPHAWPHEPRQIYLDFSCDIVYLGPEFHLDHLKSFLTATDAGLELPGLQYLAMDRKSWLGNTLRGRPWHGPTIFPHEDLRTALYSLHSRPLKELYIVPDDASNALEDKYYYGKHDIWFQEPEFTYTFRPAGQPPGPAAKTAVENLREWFERLWVEKGLEPPKVLIQSVRRNGWRMSDYRDGVWEVQRMLGDMRVWKNWNPL